MVGAYAAFGAHAAHFIGVVIEAAMVADDFGFFKFELFGGDVFAAIDYSGADDYGQKYLRVGADFYRPAFCA